MLLLTDVQGLTDTINNTGRVYEKIGNMHGQQVGSVLVCTVYHMLQYLLLYSWDTISLNFA